MNLMDSASHVITRDLDHRSSISMASYDVASTMHQSRSGGGSGDGTSGGASGNGARNFPQELTPAAP